MHALGGSLGEEDQVARNAEARADLAQLVRLLGAESEEDLSALFLHVWEGLSYLEVATDLVIPIEMVRSRLIRLRRRLEAALGDQAEDPQATQLKVGE